MEKKITKDELVIIAMILSVAISIVAVKLYSGSMYMGPAKSGDIKGELQCESTTHTQTDYQVMATLPSETQSQTEETVTEEITEKYEVMPDIVDKVVEYDKAEDAQSLRKPVKEEPATKAPTLPPVTQVTAKPDNYVFTITAPLYDSKGNVVYQLTDKTKVLKQDEIKTYIKGDKTEIIIKNGDKYTTIKGYVYAKDFVGTRKTEVITKLLVPVGSQKESQDAVTEKATAAGTSASEASSKTVSKETESSTGEEVTEKKTQDSGETQTETKTTDVTEKNSEESNIKETEAVSKDSGQNPSKGADEGKSEASGEKQSEVSTERTSESQSDSYSALTEYYVYELKAYTNDTKMNTKVSGWYKQGDKTYYYYHEKSYAVGMTDIAGVKYYFNSEGELSSMRGIDVSMWQGKIDWKKVKDAGIEFVIIRAGVRGYQTGKLSIDERFAENVKGARENGLVIGAYIFSQAINEKEMQEEASLIVTLCKQYNITGPVVIDSEEVNSWVARQNKLSKEERTRLINMYGDIVRNNGFSPMLYTGASWLETAIDSDKLTGMRRWIAKWSKTPPKCDYEIWQYSDSGRIDGIKEYVDLNVWIKE